MSKIEPIPLNEVEHLTSLRVVMFKRVYDLNPAADLELSVSELGNHLQAQPSKYAFYASLRDLASTKVDQLNAKYHRIRAQHDRAIRETGYMPDGAKITEDSLRRYLTTVDEVVVAEKDMLKAQAEAAMCNSLVRAFEQRRDCLIALANRQNSGVFHDKDAEATVHANISPLQQLQAATEGVGAHPSKKAKK